MEEFKYTDEFGRPYRLSVKLHGRQNVIISFKVGEITEPFMWGFETIDTFRSYLKMLLRFDETIVK